MLYVMRTFWYARTVIVSFRDKRTRDFAEGKRVKPFAAIERSARLKLDRLEAATSLRDLAALPGNRFESLLGERRGQYSIRINDQWRICFEWPGRAPGPSNVEIVDHH
jgi:toxin HigB-1